MGVSLGSQARYELDQFTHPTGHEEKLLLFYRPIFGGVLVAYTLVVRTAIDASSGESTGNKHRQEIQSWHRGFNAVAERNEDLPFASHYLQSRDRTRLATFGRFVGDWHFRSEIYRSDGSIKHGNGEWSFRWILSGRAIQDVWQLEAESPAKGRRYAEIGTTLRLFDAQKNVWHVVWMASVHPAVEVFTASTVGQDIVLRGKDPDGSITEWSFQHIGRDSFEWFARSSSDEGRTWRTEQRMWVSRDGARKE